MQKYMQVVINMCSEYIYITVIVIISFKCTLDYRIPDNI